MSLYSWMQVARKESQKSTYKQKIGAVIVTGGSCLSRGFNEIRHCDDHKKHSPWANALHSERSAIRAVKNKDSLVGAAIYIYREHKNGQPALAMPCPSCFELIRAVGIKKVYFSTGKYPFYAEIRI